MKSFWKQSEARATALKHNIFLKARLKLTGLYVLILALIVIAFSVLLYKNIANNLSDARDEDFSGIESRHHFVDQTLGSVQNNIIISDSIVILLAAILSYLLAGETLKPIKKSLESQKSFAAQASHELRTPLTIMRTDIESLLKNNNHTKQLTEEIMHSNLEEINHLTIIAENLLLLARSDNHVVPNFKKIDVTETISRVIERVSPIALERNIKINFSPTLETKIQGDENTFSRAILNILQNSLDYTKNGDFISIDIQKNEKSVIIRISDTGPGIDQKDLPYIFNRFYKGNKSTNSHGTGLGLSIVKEIIDQHNGGVEITSGLGKGTTAIFQLPLV